MKTGTTRWRQILRGNVLMMGLVSLFTDASSEMIYPLLPVFFTGLASTATAAVYVGLMEGVAESFSSLLKIFSGRLSDRLRRRKFFAVTGYAISSVSRPAMALAGAAWHVVALRFVDRVGKGLRTSPRDALISDSVDRDNRGMAFSFHRAMDHTGAVLGPLFAVGILFLLLGYGLWRGSSERATPREMQAMRILFGLALVPGMAAMYTLARKVRDVAPAPAAEPQARKGAPGGGRTGRRFHLFLAAVTLFALGNSSDLFLVFYARVKFQLGLLQVILMWVALHLAKIVFSLPGGLAADRIGRRAAILCGWVLYVAVYVGMATLRTPAVFWLLLLVYGAYYGMSEGAEKALVADIVPSARRGHAYGLYHGAVGLAALPASLLFGVFWAALGPARAFGIGAGLAAAATLLLAGLVVSDRVGKAA